MKKFQKKMVNFFSRNYNFKILPEGLNRYFNVEYIVRKSNVREHHKLNLDKIKVASNIFQFIYFVLSTFRQKNTKYYIIISHHILLFHFYFYLFLKKKYLFI